MRRPSLACRRAVQSIQCPPPQHIWISDDLLKLAVNRFFKSSCPHQKRSGSHVPGPLEARRRATKRPMTLAANDFVQETPLPNFGLNGLFKLFQEPRPAYRYEPPSQRAQTEPLDLPLPTQPPPFRLDRPHNSDIAAPSRISNKNVTQISPPMQAYFTEAMLQNGTFAKEVDDRTVDVPSEMVNVENSFERFQEQVAGVHSSSSEHRNRAIRETFERCRPSHPEAWRYNAMVASYITEHGWSPVPFLHHSESLAIPPTYTAEHLALMRCLDQWWAEFTQIRLTIRRLCEDAAVAATYAEQSDSPIQDQHLMSLVKLLWQSSITRNGSVDSSTIELLNMVTDKISKKQDRRALYSILLGPQHSHDRVLQLTAEASTNETFYKSMKDVFSCIPYRVLDSIVPSATFVLVKAATSKSKRSATRKQHLITWLRLLDHVDTTNPSKHPKTTSLVTAILEILKYPANTRHQTCAKADLFLAAVAFQLSRKDLSYSALNDLLQDGLDLSSDRSISFEARLVTIFTALRDRSLPYKDALLACKNLFTNHLDDAAISRFLVGLAWSNFHIEMTGNSFVTREDGTVSQKSKATRMQQDDTQTASKIQLMDLDRSMSVADPVDTDTSTPTQLRALQANLQFDHILDRARTDFAMPIKQSHRSAENTSQDKRAFLIHQIAHQYSSDKTLSSREQSRALRYLYQYLVQHDMPIGKLFTQAVVRAFVIRPMWEQQWVDQSQIVWVCNVIARAGDESAAKSLEALFWRWRGELIQRARAAQARIGKWGGGKVHVQTMRRLGLLHTPRRDGESRARR